MLFAWLESQKLLQFPYFGIVNRAIVSKHSLVHNQAWPDRCRKTKRRYEDLDVALAIFFVQTGLR